MISSTSSPRGVVAAHLAGDQHVLAHGQQREQLEPLERAGHAEARPLVRARAELSSRAAEAHRTAGGLSRPQTALNSVVLPAPFGPIRPVTKPGVGIDVDLVERDVPAEPHGDAAALESSAPRQRDLRQAEPRVELGCVLGRERPVDADPLERHVGELDPGRFLGLGRGRGAQRGDRA